MSQAECSSASYAQIIPTASFYYMTLVSKGVVCLAGTTSAEYRITAHTLSKDTTRKITRVFQCTGIRSTSEDLCVLSFYVCVFSSKTLTSMRYFHAYKFFLRCLNVNLVNPITEIGLHHRCFLRMF